uniref:Uncharacterized protein n=1 Tax=Arundo donax TaxID=35708 RepID=A0A0A9EVV0_ARUDO
MPHHLNTRLKLYCSITKSRLMFRRLINTTTEETCIFCTVYTNLKEVNNNRPSQNKFICSRFVYAQEQ